MSRSCGACRACCVSMTIPEYPPAGKPAGVPCKHALPASEGCGGCGVFGRRREAVGAKMAAICEGFRCGWLLGFGTDADRPDKSGLIAVQTPEGRSIFEVEPGSLDRPEARDLIRRLRADGVALGVVYLNGRKAIYPAAGNAAKHVLGGR